MAKIPCHAANVIAVLFLMTSVAIASDSLTPHLSRGTGPLYFLLVDRFDDAVPGPDGQPRAGYDPTDAAFYNGGDLAGVRRRLDYLAGLGVTGLWLSPIARNQPVQWNAGWNRGKGRYEAGYHGYWILDFLHVEPHFGTDADFDLLIEEAHARGMRVFLDIITNHTADVIRYRECPDGRPGDAPETKVYPCPYRSRVETAYTAYVPLGMERSKNPLWLNDPGYYHSRGDFLGDFGSAQGRESSLDGDFFGLDDLMTEHPAVVTGMIDIYKSWIDRGVDGFRIDTARHVGDAFWKQFIPALQTHAAEQGKPDFFIFGEVFVADPAFTARFVRDLSFPAVLDFPMQAAAADVIARGHAPDRLRRVFAEDDRYITGRGTDARALPTFLGNHDMGRIGHFILTGQAAVSLDEAYRRLRLAHALLLLTRGVPILYYGDEQGFTGDGGDRDARQSMFPSRVASYKDDELIGGGGTTAKDHFRPDHPLYQEISRLSALRSRHPGLAAGAQVERWAETGGPGLYAFSRIDPAEGLEYLVILNTAREPQSAELSVFPGPSAFHQIDPQSEVGSGWQHLPVVGGSVQVSLAPLDFKVFRADRGVVPGDTAPTIDVVAAVAEGESLVEICAVVPLGAGYGVVDFSLQRPEGEAWLGRDTAPTYIAPYDATACPRGLPVYRVFADRLFASGGAVTATFTDARGRTATTTKDYPGKASTD